MMISQTYTGAFAAVLACSFAAKTSAGTGTPVDHMGQVRLEFDQKLDGCCRSRTNRNTLSNKGTSTTVTLTDYQGTSAQAAFDCMNLCEGPACSAIEVTRKSSKKYKCEMHTTLINAATQSTRSCKKSSCYFKSELPATLPQAAAPIDLLPLVTDFDETVLDGCCREEVDGKTLNHHNDVTTIAFDRKEMTLKDGETLCRQHCLAEKSCSAAEFSRGKKGPYKCELHKALINKATRQSKSCKRAKCFLFWL